jgi:5-carboxymethyl-2-hydroxymuconic-semialdehyde dehydrogenase
VLRSPAGIAGLIGSWNAPFLSVARQLAPALAAGCLVIVKTHEWTPVSASVLPEIMAEAGVPAGVFTLLHGRRAEDAVPALLAHAQVPLISFSGEASAVQETIQAAAHLKRVSARSTGATPCVIFGDADLDRAVDSALFGAFALNGTAPGAGSRILVESSVYDDVVARLAARAAVLRVGPPSDPETEIGPLTHPELHDRLVKQVRLGVREEARLAAGGSRPAGLPEGNYLAPTVFADVTPSMRIFTEEIAGPVAYVTSFSSQDEAVSAASALSGRSASVWTADLKRAETIAGMLKASATWVNSAGADTPAAADMDLFTRSRTVNIADGDDPVPAFGSISS